MGGHGTQKADQEGGVPPMRKTHSFVVLMLGLVLALTACGGDDDSSSQASSPTASAKGELTVGGANFTEMLIMQQMYKLLLEKAGFTVKVQSVDNRELYAPALRSGDIDVVPEYLATMTEYLNHAKNGPDAPTIATSDAAETVNLAKPLAQDYGLVVLNPAQAIDANAFAVTKKFADDNSLKTLSDLAALHKPIVLAATEECPERPFCQPGLEKTYGLNITKVDPLGFGSTQTKQAVKEGTAQLGLVGTTDGTLDQFGLVVLEDDKHLQLADNLVPFVNAKSAEDPAIATALNQLSNVLTTDDLAQLNLQVDGERMEPADVAQAYLKGKGLI
jgi:osmoprotectant transport system substrate-binding protein